MTNAFARSMVKYACQIRKTRKIRKKLHWITFEDTNIFIQICLNINLLIFK